MVQRCRKVRGKVALRELIQNFEIHRHAHDVTMMYTSYHRQMSGIFTAARVEARQHHIALGCVVTQLVEGDHA